MDLFTAFETALDLAVEGLDDEKHRGGLYDYALHHLDFYKQFTANNGNKEMVKKLESIDDNIVELLYFMLDDMLNLLIRKGVL